MGNKFVSTIDSFVITLPDGWSEYDDGEEAYCFFNPTNEAWSGNLRITYLEFPDADNLNSDKAGQYMTDELKDNPEAIEIVLGNHKCIYYKNTSEDDCLIYYWVTGESKHLFLCSFTIDKRQEHTQLNKQQLESVKNIITSIEVI